MNESKSHAPWYLVFIGQHSEVDILRRLMAELKVNQTNKSYLNTLSEAFLRRAFFGLFGKGPSMPVDTCPGSPIICCYMQAYTTFLN